MKHRLQILYNRIMSSRKLGNGYSLALHTGNGTHLTLVYFNKLKRGYEQNLVKSITIDYFRANKIEEIELEFGDLHESRSIRVHGAIESIISDLKDSFKSFDIDLGHIPHIDLRGRIMADLSKKVSVIDNFVY
jgi:hypothetical protein